MTAGSRIVIIDTNVASFCIRGLPIAQDYRRLLAGYEVRMCFVTPGELYYWAKKDQWGNPRYMQLQRFLHECPVVPYQPRIAEVFGRVMAERRWAGRRMEHADAWIAATALYHAFPLATHDADFLHTSGLRIITASETIRSARMRLPDVMRPGPTLNIECRCGL